MKKTQTKNLLHVILLILIYAIYFPTLFCFITGFFIAILILINGSIMIENSRLVALGFLLFPVMHYAKKRIDTIVFKKPL